MYNESGTLITIFHLLTSQRGAAVLSWPSFELLASMSALYGRSDELDGIVSLAS